MNIITSDTTGSRISSMMKSPSKKTTECS
jgi:hypothetical protein